MRLGLVALVACGGASVARAPARVRVPDGALVLEHVSVVPMDREVVLADQDIAIAGDRIVAVAPAAELDIPASATRRDLRGRFVMPGLADMHAHATDDEDLQLYLAAGVTQIRLMHWAEDAVAQRERVAAGTFAGPSIHIEGQITDGDPPVWPWSIAVKTKEDVDRVIAWHVSQHLPAIKVYERLPLALYDAIVAGARAHGMRVVGHVSENVGLVHALASKQDSIEHLEGYSAYLSGESRHFGDPGAIDVFGGAIQWERADRGKMADIARRTKEAGTWNCPTLVVFDHISRSEEAATRAGFAGARYLSPMKRRLWDVSKGFGSVPPSHADFAAMQHALANARAMVAALHAAGAGLLVGTDSNNPGIVPGFSVLDELDLFVTAGVPRFAALRASTSDAARFLGADFGVVATGKRADLLIGEGNPLDDFATLRHPVAVVARGRWHDTAALVAALETRVPYYTGDKSLFEGVPARAVDGTRELTARYRTVEADLVIDEQRVTIDRRAAGDRVIVAEDAQGYQVRVEVGDGRGAAITFESAGFVHDVRRDHGKLAVSTTMSGKTDTRTVDDAQGAVLTSVTFAPDWLFYAEAMKLAVGKSTKVTSVSAPVQTPSSKVQTIELARKPDETRPVAGTPAPVRVFALTLDGQAGELVLDAHGALVSQTLAGEVTTRVE